MLGEWALTCGLLMAAAAVGTGDTDSLPVAITGVTVHDGQGDKPYTGTILLAGGRIVEAGRDVTPPAQAEVLSGEGLYAYAAFIDAHSHLGIAPTARTIEQRRRVEDEYLDPRQGPAVPTAAADRRGLRPQTQAFDLFAPVPDDLAAWQRAGFGTVLAAPRGGILGGWSALVEVTDVPLRRAVLDRAATQHASFDPDEPGLYPQALLGTIAAFRQFCYDVQWHRDMAQYVRRHPRALEQAPADPALEAMWDVLAGRRPLVFAAETEQEILRALALAEEFKLRLVISGGREAWRAADLLRAARIPVILTLQFDEEPAWGRTGADRGNVQPDTADKAAPPDDFLPWQSIHAWREQRRLWDEQVRNLQVLTEAGVLAAVGTRAAANPQEVLTHLRQAVEAGLNPEAGLAALTSNPARLLGVDEQLGTIETGRRANIVLFTGPWESSAAVVRHMFVDGRRRDYLVDGKDRPATASRPTPVKTDVSIPEWPIETEADRRPALRTGGNVLIRGGTVLTGTGEAVPDGAVLIQNGRIAAVGKDLAEPAGVVVIDAAGQYVVPGLIDAHTHLAMKDVDEPALAVTSEVRAADVLDHRDVAISRALAGGVTTVHTMHGSDNPVGGENAVLKLRYGRRPADMIFTQAPRGLKFALGENVTQANQPARDTRFPNSRMGVDAVIHQAFAAGSEYRQARQRHADAIGTGTDPPPLRRDLRVESLAALLDGQVWAHCHGYRAGEHLRFLDLAEEYGFRVGVLHHALEAYRIMPEIVRHGCGVSTFANLWAYKLEAYTAAPASLGELVRRGVSVTVNSDSDERVRYLNLEAAKTQRWAGLNAEQALRLITLEPARQLGIDRWVGSLEAGKDGDVAIFNGPPLDGFSRCVMTLIDGEVYFAAGPSGRVVPVTPVRTAEAVVRPLPSGEHALYALTHARVCPMSGPPLDDATVLIRNEIIDAVGPDVAIPPGAVVVDLAGAHVYPGMIDAASLLGLAEIMVEPATRDDKEIAEFQPELLASSALNPASAHLVTARAAGITTAVCVPGGGCVNGRSAVIDLAGWTASEMQRVGVWALHVSLPVPDDDVPPAERAGKRRDYEEKLRRIEEFIRRARAYHRARGVPGADSAAPALDLRYEALGPYLRGQAPVVFAARRYRAIVEAVQFAERHGLRAIISGGQEAWKCADMLAAKRIPVILAPVTTLPAGEFEPYDSVYGCAARLDAAGVAYCFGSASASGACNLPVEVSLAVAHGLPPERAMQALTRGAAEILGLSGEVGTLEAGKRANLVVCSDLPLQPAANVLHVFINGRPVELQGTAAEHLERYQSRPAPALPPARELVGPPALSRPASRGSKS